MTNPLHGFLKGSWDPRDGVMRCLESLDADEELIDPAINEVLEVISVAQSSSVCLKLNLLEPSKRGSKLNIFVQIFKGRKLRAGENKVFTIEFFFKIDEGPVKQVEVNEGQLFFDTRQHADDTVVITAIPNRDGDVFSKIDSRGLHG
jgi:hypothetical protein